MAILSLVGAGPGDPDRMTLKSIRWLERADVVLYDALANEEILIHARDASVKKFVGKRYGCRSLSQKEINDLVLDYASH